MCVLSSWVGLWHCYSLCQHAVIDSCPPTPVVLYSSTVVQQSASPTRAPKNDYHSVKVNHAFQCRECANLYHFTDSKFMYLYQIRQQLSRIINGNK